MNDNPLIIDNEEKFHEILQSHVRFFALIYASWCPFCIRFLPVFEKCSREMLDDCYMVKDDQETIADIYAVDVVPTVLFFVNGAVSKRLNGRLGIGLTENQLLDFSHKCN